MSKIIKIENIYLDFIRMKLKCNNCKEELKSEDINISTDLAKCFNCGSVLKISELAFSSEKIKLPNNSKIKVQNDFDGSVNYSLPKKGFTVKLIPIILFATFWIGFITFWTWGASQGSVFFALFSIPFWLVGCGFILSILNSIYEYQTIKVTRDNLIIKKYKPIRTITFETKLNTIQSVRMKNIGSNPLNIMKGMNSVINLKNTQRGIVELPTVITGQTTKTFFENANVVEQEWITTTLDILINEKRR